MMTEEDIFRAKVVRVAKSWLGTPYHHMGRVKGVGIDCAMLIAETYTEAGLIPRPDIGYYSYDWHKNHSEEKYMDVVLKYTREVTEGKPGDIVLWKFGRTFSHGGLIIKWPLVLHAYIDRPCGMDDVTQAHWLKYRGESDSSKRPVKFYRLNQWSD